MAPGRPAGPTLAAVVAHPDDDAYRVAGIVALHAADPRLHFVLVHATDGEAGTIAPDTGVTRATLGAVRREDDRRAWEVLGRMPDRHEWFGYPDGALAQVPQDELIDRVAAVLSDERPDVVVTSGPDGITGHRTPRSVWGSTPRGSRPGIRAAMREHRTQRADLDPPHLSEEQKLRSVSRETEVLVWPSRVPGRVLTDVFEGL